MLLGIIGEQARLLAVPDLRHVRVGGFARVVNALFVYRCEAREAQLLAGMMEVHVAGNQLRRQRVVHGGGHLAGDEAIVNQLVQLVLIVAERGF